jgi:hypothetical protein
VTHYETLGIAPDATAETVRAAYLAKARVLHPDRVVGRDPVAVAEADAAMRAVNAAWAELRLPASRRRYDERVGLRPRAGAPVAATAAHPAPAPAAPGPSGAWHIGSRLVLATGLAIVCVLVVAGAVVLIGRAVVGSPEPAGNERVVGVPAPGACVVLDGSGLREVGCREPHDARVAVVGTPGLDCPAATTAVDVVPYVTRVCLRPDE